MKIMKKSIAALLIAALVITMLPAGLPSAYAAERGTAAGGDAFAALGIDTSIAPDGFDENSIDNPYGRATIKVNTVSELYTVGLDTDVSTINAWTYTSEPNENTENSTLKYTLYGDGSGLDSISAALGEKTENKQDNVSVKASADYVKLNESSTIEKYYRTGFNTASSDTGVMYDVAAGNFDGNREGKTAQIAMVYTKAYSANGGLYLKFGDAKGNFGNTSIELLSTSKKLGNPNLKIEGEDKKAENFAENPYQLKNYLQVATGDWNGDGTDDVAVYIPEEGNSRICIFSAQKTENGGYKEAGNWGLAWSYYLKEDNVVSNMISMTSGDVDRDGIDDLACSWGYYYGPAQNKGSKAVVMFGGKDKDMLKRSQQFDISYGSSNIVRASFTYGDIGTGEETLILCGQADSDLKDSNTYSRYVALYSWNGKNFNVEIAKNFDLFKEEGEENEKTLVYPAMSRYKTGDRYVFYSMPLCPANTAVITKGISDDGSNKLYFDSLVFTYTDEGLALAEAWDIQYMQKNNSKKEYVEYDGVAGDLTGKTGAGALMTVIQELSSVAEKKVSYTAATGVQTPKYKKETYYKNWFYKLLGIKSYRWVQDGYDTQATNVEQKYNETSWGDTNLVIVEPVENGHKNNTKVNSSFSLCLANTDNDSSYMNYAGTHYYRYSDPKVLAVLASPPYFKDLLNRGDLSGNYAESTTTYSSTSGQETGTTSSSTVTLGAYVSFEQEFSVFGVKVAQAEAEAVITGGFTYETEQTSSLEQTITYSATSGEDKVALYSIPMEIYQYESYVPDASGNYEKVITEVNIPHEACIKLLDLSEYESIAEDYSILPTIAESVLRHTIGDPSTYPTSTAGYNVIAEYNGTPASVGFTSKDGGDTISQEIAMSTSTGTSYSSSTSVETKAGAGAAGVTVGVVAGSENSSGCVSISTEGSSFSGELQAMPIEAKPYGYAMNWRIFCYRYKGADMEFPVVSYLVSEVAQPASLPEDFEQDVAETTADSVTLKWSYDKYVSGFQIYRYYEFPDGSGSYRLKYIPFSQGVKNGDRFEFSYTDEGLSPYTEYKYQIQTESSYRPGVSIYSEPISCRTKTTLGYPVMTVSGLIEDGSDKGKLAIYPDAEGKATVTVSEESKYNSISYQWQKLVNSQWTNMPGYKTNELTITNASAADKGIYRCRVNAIYFDNTSQKEFSISAYTDTIEALYTKRTPDGELTVTAQKYGDKKDIDGVHAEIELHSANINNMTAPTGSITFTIEGKDYVNTKTVNLTKENQTKEYSSEKKYYSKATVDFTGLAEGTYRVKYYYSGDSVFKDKTLETGKIVAVGEGQGYALDLKSGDNVVTKFTYGDEISPVLYAVSANTSEPTQVEEGVTYEYLEKGGNKRKKFNADDALSAGQYTLFAYLNKEEVASATFTVEKKALKVSAVKKDNVTEWEKDKPSLVTDIADVTAEALGVTYKIYNSAGNEMEFSSDTEPGNYTIMPCFIEEDKTYEARGNYEITFESAVYTIIGLTYQLEVAAKPYSDNFSQNKTVGTAAISSNGLTAGNFTKGSAIQLYAVPDAGYEVEKWVVKTEGYNDAEHAANTLDNPSRLNIEMKPGKTTVEVYFKVKDIYLNLIERTGGTVLCDDEYFESGAKVSRGSEFRFTAKPVAGYTFNQWIINETGFNSVYSKGTMADDGTSTIDIEIGTNDITLQATYIRDSYTVNLEGDIIAYYNKQKNDGTGTEKIIITDGMAVTGDTEIFVEPKIGYSAAEGAFITVNGEATDKTSQHRFSLTENTRISLDTVREQYSVTASGENGKVYITSDDIPVLSGNTVDGGSRVVFEAIADRGYVFDHWQIGDDESVVTDEYVISEIGEAVNITAVFTANSKNTVTGTVSPEQRGKLTYTLYDIYGNILEEAADYSTPIEMYKGETIAFKAVPNAGSMVEQWIVDGERTVSSAKNYPGGLITMGGADITIETIFVPSTSYKLCFAVGAEQNEGTLEVKADKVSVQSGDDVPGGADVVFKATPAEGKMIDHWTITQGDATVVPTDDKGNIFVDPEYTIEGFRGNQTVRVYYTDCDKHDISVTGNNAETTITYVTKIKATDNTISNKVRKGGTVKLTVTPKAGYATSGADISGAFGASSVEYIDGSYNIVLRNVTGDISVDLDGRVDKLYSISKGESRCSIADVNSTKTYDNPQDKMVRGGSNVTFKLVPESGYRINRSVAENWAGVTVGDDLTVTVENITSDITVPAELFEKIPVPAGGGGGGAIMPPEENNKNDEGQIKTDKITDSNGKTVTVVAAEGQIDKSKDGNSLILSVENKLMEELIQEAAGEKADSIVIGTGKLSDEMSALAEDIEVAIDKAFVKDIIEKTEAELVINTLESSLKIDRPAMEAILDQLGNETSFELEIKNVTAEDYSHIVGEDAYVVSLNMVAGKKNITDFGKGKIQIKLAVPEELKDKEIIAVYLADDGKYEKFDGKKVTEKVKTEEGMEKEITYYIFETDHFSDYALAEKISVDSYEKTQKTITGIRETAVTLKSVAAKKKIKLSWKKAKGYKVDGYEVYRSTSKNGKYVKIYSTKNTKACSCTNTINVKSGKTYYYKVRGFRTVDGNKIYTKWSNLSYRKAK